MIAKVNAMSASIVRKTGHSGAELGGLAAGGALIAIMPKALAQVSSLLGMPSISANATAYWADRVWLPLLIGIGINTYAKGSMAQAIGKGIAAAAVVNLGVSATQYAASAAGMPLAGYIVSPGMSGYVSAMNGYKKPVDFQGYKAFGPGSGDFAGWPTNGYVASSVDYKGFQGEYVDASEENDPEDGAGSAQTG